MISPSSAAAFCLLFPAPSSHTLQSNSRGFHTVQPNLGQLFRLPVFLHIRNDDCWILRTFFWKSQHLSQAALLLEQCFFFPLVIMCPILCVTSLECFYVVCCRVTVTFNRLLYYFIILYYYVLSSQYLRRDTFHLVYEVMLEMRSEFW